MSDGNIHRALLPHTPYQSGLAMGKRIMRQQARQAFLSYLHQCHPALDEAERQSHLAAYLSALG